jgi:hypothetical protein
MTPLPDYRKANPVMRAVRKTCLELFGPYVKAAKPPQSTVNRWRSGDAPLDSEESR